MRTNDHKNNKDYCGYLLGVCTKYAIIATVFIIINVHFLKFVIIIIIITSSSGSSVCLCVCVRVCVTLMCRYRWRPEEGTGSMGAEIPGGCRLSYVDVGNKTQILWKSRNCSQPLTLPTQIFIYKS